jgi:hypothetical protein
MFLLLLDAFGQMREIFHGAVDLAPRIFELGAIHQWRCARQPASGTVRDGQHHAQIPQQFTSYRWRFRFDLLMCSEKQLGLFQNPLPYRTRRVAPGRVE